MWFDGCSFVMADFAQKSLDNPYDMKILSEPQMHESADEVALAGESIELLHSYLSSSTNENVH